MSKQLLEQIKQTLLTKDPALAEDLQDIQNSDLSEKVIELTTTLLWQLLQKDALPKYLIISPQNRVDFQFDADWSLLVDGQEPLTLFNNKTGENKPFCFG